MFWAIDYACLAVLLSCGLVVVAVRNLNSAVMALSGLGTILTVLFVVLGAPDDAHAEVVVGAIALPTIYLVAIGKVRGDVDDERTLGEGGEEPGGRD